jgi:hypothetical protein
MLAGITLLGERSRDHYWLLTAMAFVVGSVVGGAGIGGAAGTAGSMLGLGQVSPGLRAAALVVLGMLGGAADLGIRGLQVRSWRRQVDASWMTRYRGWFYGAGFGLQLGAGVTTIVTASATYIWLAAALLSGGPMSGALVGAAYGTVRGLSILPAGRVSRPHDLVTLAETLRRFAQPVAYTVVLLQTLVLAGLLVDSLVKG